MTILKLSEKPPKGRYALRSDILHEWNPAVHAAKETDNSISLYGPIGEDYEGGSSEKRVSAALRNIGAGKEVVLNINSPGGDFFAGVGIYNQLRAHGGKVTVNILGMAASAASVVAMAGDQINIAKAAWIMIHNSWSIVIGNRNDLREAADTFESFDGAMAALYAERTGLPKATIADMMDAETRFDGEEAVEAGFANSLMAADQVSSEDDGESKKRHTKALLESALMVSDPDMSRAERRALLASLKDGTPRAARDANDLPVEKSAGIAALINILKT